MVKDSRMVIRQNVRLLVAWVEEMSMPFGPADEDLEDLAELLNDADDRVVWDDSDAYEWTS
jgi:hypothetical protein